LCKIPNRNILYFFRGFGI